jgi:hypothetical protein
MAKSNHTFTQEELVVIFLLVLIYPVGLILMWAWGLWSKNVRWLISLPAVLLCVLPIVLALLSSMSSSGY